MAKKPVPKGAEAHRSKPSGGPSGSSNTAPSSSGSSGGSSSSSSGEMMPSGGGGGGRFSLSSDQKRKLYLAGAGLAALGIAYIVLKSRSSDRGGGERPPRDDGGDDGGGGEEVTLEEGEEAAGFPSIQRDPEDPLAADEEALEWLKNPDDAARKQIQKERQEPPEAGGD